VAIPLVAPTVAIEVEPEDHVPPGVVLPKTTVAASQTLLEPEIAAGATSIFIDGVVVVGLLVQPDPV
jgi:hypothetical protein